MFLNSKTCTAEIIIAFPWTKHTTGRKKISLMIELSRHRVRGRFLVVIVDVTGILNILIACTKRILGQWVLPVAAAQWCYLWIRMKMNRSRHVYKWVIGVNIGVMLRSGRRCGLKIQKLKLLDENKKLTLNILVEHLDWQTSSRL